MSGSAVRLSGCSTRPTCLNTSWRPKPPKSSRRSFTVASRPNMRNQPTGDIVPLFPDSNEMVHNDFFYDPSFGPPHSFQEDLTAMRTNLKDVHHCVKELNEIINIQDPQFILERYGHFVPS